MEGFFFFVFWVVLSAGIGYLADSRGRSPIGFFFLALVTSPLLGLIIVLVTRNLAEDARREQMRRSEDARKEQLRREEHERQIESIRAIAAPQSSRGAGGIASNPGQLLVADELRKLGDLLERKLLTEDEFRMQKAALLNAQKSMIPHEQTSVETHEQKPATPPEQPEAERMKRLGITFDGQNYRYCGFKYERLADAIRYAEQLEARKAS